MNDKLAPITYSVFVLILALFFLQSCRTVESESPHAPNIDIQIAPKNPTLFGEHLISTPLYERDMAISPNGNEIIFTRGDYKQSRRCLVIVNKHKGEWGHPAILSFSGEYHDIEPFYSNGGERLYFASNRPIYNDKTRTDYNIWYSNRIEGTWSKPEPLDSIINTRGDEFFPSLSNKGNLFFTASRENGIGKEDIFISAFVDGAFQSPEPLSQEVNSTVYEFNAFVSPNEQYIIFSSFGREDGFGGGDLYLSERDSIGNWQKARNMGEVINSNKLDYCPFVDWDSQNFYFTSERATLDTSKIENVKALTQMANGVGNGYGDIYKIAFDEIEFKH